MNKNIVITADQYDRIDGSNAYSSDTKKLTLGKSAQAENKSMPIAATIWKQKDEGSMNAVAEVPFHQVLDMAILACQSLVYFQEAYRYPLLYNPENPSVERIGLQGGVMPISVCMENPHITEDIQDFSQAINDLGELTGERLRVLARILKEMGY